MTPSPTPPAASPLADHLCFSIYAAGLAFNRLYKQVLDRWGLTYPQYLVLVALRDGDDHAGAGPTVGELAALLHLESNTVTPLLKRLETAGLVARRRDADDERVVHIALTGEGRSVAAELGCVPETMVAATGAQPGDLDRLPALIRELDALAERLREAAA